MKLRKFIQFVTIIIIWFFENMNYFALSSDENKITNFFNEVHKSSEWKRKKKHFKLYRFICFIWIMCYVASFLCSCISEFLCFTILTVIVGFCKIPLNVIQLLCIYLSSILHLRTIKILVNVLLISNISIEIFVIIFL